MEKIQWRFLIVEYYQELFCREASKSAPALSAAVQFSYKYVYIEVYMEMADAALDLYKPLI